MQTENMSKLKPALAGPLGASLLDELNSIEAKRFADNNAAIKQFCTESINTEISSADAYGIQISQITEIFFKLLDQCVTPADLSLAGCFD